MDHPNGRLPPTTTAQKRNYKLRRSLQRSLFLCQRTAASGQYPPPLARGRSVNCLSLALLAASELAPNDPGGWVGFAVGDPGNRLNLWKSRQRGCGGSRPGWAEVLSMASGALARNKCLSQGTVGLRAGDGGVLFSASLQLRCTTPSGCGAANRPGRAPAEQ